jgi:putative sigma-54 modulation protein
MELKIQSVGFSASERLEMFVQKKVDKLKTVYDGVSNANVYLKLENTSEVENKVGEIRVDVKGTELFVKKQSKTFEESIDNCVDALKKQLTKYKEKLRD